MTISPKSDFKAALKNTLGKYHTAITALLFLIGMVLRLYVAPSLGIEWQILGDLGTFLAGTIAISFIYERFLRSEDRRVFLSDLDEFLEAKLSQLSVTNRNAPTIHERGRLPLDQKVAFFRDAQSEVIELGIGLRSFVGYFDQRPANEFREPVLDLMRRGVRIRCVALDPDSSIAKHYWQDRGEPELEGNIRGSLNRLQNLREEFQQLGLGAQFEVFNYSHLPYCYVLLVDPDGDGGRALVSHYMYATRRSETPTLEIRRAISPILFEKYRDMVLKLVSTSRRI